METIIGNDTPKVFRKLSSDYADFHRTDEVPKASEPLRTSYFDKKNMADGVLFLAVNSI